MSLSFLSKKSWHTTNLQNVEKVWLAEQAEKKEAEKLDQWKKEREEERQIEQLRQLQRETGQAHARQGPERVDWLYEQPTTSGTEYLMGKAMEVKPEESEVKQVEHMPGSTFLNGQNNLSNAANEEFNKMTNDPLVAMRAAEQKALQAIINNPVKMKQIRQQAGGGSAPPAAAATTSQAALAAALDEMKREKKRKKEKKKDEPAAEPALSSLGNAPNLGRPGSRSPSPDAFRGLDDMMV